VPGCAEPREIRSRGPDAPVRMGLPGTKGGGASGRKKSGWATERTARVRGNSVLAAFTALGETGTYITLVLGLDIGRRPLGTELSRLKFRQSSNQTQVHSPRTTRMVIATRTGHPGSPRGDFHPRPVIFIAGSPPIARQISTGNTWSRGELRCSGKDFKIAGIRFPDHPAWNSRAISGSAVPRDSASFRSIAMGGLTSWPGGSLAVVQQEWHGKGR
jgi:hypothetical protein